MNDAPRKPYAIFTPRKKPLLIWLAPAGIALMLLNTVAFVSLILVHTAMDGGGQTVLLGSPLSPAELIWRVVPMTLAVSFLMLTLARGLFVQRIWARRLAVWQCMGVTVIVFILAPPRVMWAVIVQLLPYAIVFTAVAYWYFYRKRNVADYYATLEAEQGKQAS